MAWMDQPDTPGVWWVKWRNGPKIGFVVIPESPLEAAYWLRTGYVFRFNNMYRFSVAFYMKNGVMYVNQNPGVDILDLREFEQSTERISVV